jgi:5-methylcytosine-specific restriction enzyme A
MTRPVDEWIGRADETPVPARVRLRIIDRQGSRCACGCGVKLGLAGERIEFDHRPALINGGENRESMIEAVRAPCHRIRTNEDVAEKAAVARKRKKALGLHRSKATLPGSKASKWKRKVSGEVVRRGE